MNQVLLFSLNNQHGTVNIFKILSQIRKNKHFASTGNAKEKIPRLPPNCCPATKHLSNTLQLKDIAINTSAIVHSVRAAVMIAMPLLQLSI